MYVCTLSVHGVDEMYRVYCSELRATRLRRTRGSARVGRGLGAGRALVSCMALFIYGCKMYALHNEYGTRWVGRKKPYSKSRA